MFTYAIRESVSVPFHFTIAYRDEETGEYDPWESDEYERWLDGL